MSCDVLFRDEHLIAVNKPSGMLVHPGASAHERVAMKLVRDLVGQWVYPVHRLDRGTSGVLLFALSPEVAAAMTASFAARQVSKRYLALVRGIPPEQGVIDYALPNKEDGPRVDALTHYRRLGTFSQFALMQVEPQTGRPHQIRLHFKLIAHPLVGDTRYGEPLINQMFRDRFALQRVALHALHLAFLHPMTGGAVGIDAPVPEDLSGPLSAMGLIQ